jgi:3'-phosphoadenosine 5'-phosphosulfate sulfotransferase (PAPS reductase)/FAD synthetase
VKIDFASYDHIIIAFSGGKDSMACLLALLEAGCPTYKIELWHHLVDGRDSSELMDWPVTTAYVDAVAAAFRLPVYYSWKAGGFEREMDRDDAPTAPIYFEVPGPVWKYIETTGGAGPKNTRKQFPQVSADLRVRWCSAYLKIDVAAAALRNQARFERARTLFVTGERAQESQKRLRELASEEAIRAALAADPNLKKGRAGYLQLEPHRSDLRDNRKIARHIDHYRPVLYWSEQEVWAAMERHLINPHPAYRLGWGRVSCAACIFGSPSQWASLRVANPFQFAEVARKEQATGKTIQRKLSVVELADSGRPYAMSEADIQAAGRPKFDEPIFLPEGTWKLPAGAYGDLTGPT